MTNTAQTRPERTKAVEAITLKLLTSLDPAVRREAALALASYADISGSWTALRHGLGDKDRGVREAAADSMEKLVAQDPAYVEAAIARLNDFDVPVDVELARFLVRIGTPEALEGIYRVLCSDNLEKRDPLLDLLAESSFPEKRLLAGIQSKEKNELQAAAEILIRRGDERGDGAMLGRLCSQNVVDGYIARGREGIRLACRLIEDCSREVKEDVPHWQAARRSVTEPIVHELVDDGDARCARVALAVLGHWDHPRSVEVLLRVARDAARTQPVRPTLESRDPLAAPRPLSHPLVSGTCPTHTTTSRTTR